MKILPSRKHVRLRAADYSHPGNYFVTMCTENKRCLFGSVANGTMVLNAAGETVRSVWISMPFHHESIDLDEFIVMPNHVHGIVRILDGDRRPQLATLISAFESTATRLLGHSVWQRGFHEHIVRSSDELNKVRAYIATNPSNWERDPDCRRS